MIKAVNMQPVNMKSSGRTISIDLEANYMPVASLKFSSVIRLLNHGNAHLQQYSQQIYLRKELVTLWSNTFGPRQHFVRFSTIPRRRATAVPPYHNMIYAGKQIYDTCFRNATEQRKHTCYLYLG